MNKTTAARHIGITAYIQKFLTGPDLYIEIFTDGTTRKSEIEVLHSTDRNGTVDGTIDRITLWDGTTIVDVSTSSTCSDIFGTARFVNGVLEASELFHYDGYSVEVEEDEMFAGFLDGFDASFDAFGPFTMEEV